MPTVLSIFGVSPTRITSQEAFARELSMQLGQFGWKSVVCYDGTYTEKVRSYLQLPNVCLEVFERPENASWRAVKALIQLLRRHRPQILHLNHTGFLGPYPWLARLLSTSQVVFTDHGSRPENHVIRRAPGWKRLATQAINLPLNKVICVSEYGRRCWLGLNVLPAERFALVYNGIKLDRAAQSPDTGARFRSKYSIPSDHAIVAQVSWIIPEKGIADLLQTARIVISENPKVHFVLVGEGNYRQQYTELGHQLGIGDHVTWTGSLEDPFAEGVYAAADVVCQLSRWEEVFGYVIAEAMASHLPVVGTRVGGIPELVHDGENGFLVEKGDTAKAAERILTLVRDPELRQRMGDAGRRRAEADFDLQKNVKQLIELYGIR